MRRPALTARRVRLLRVLADAVDAEAATLLEQYVRAERKRPRDMKKAAAYVRQLCEWHEARTARRARREADK